MQQASQDENCEAECVCLHAKEAQKLCRSIYSTAVYSANVSVGDVEIQTLFFFQIWAEDLPPTVDAHGSKCASSNLAKTWSGFSQTSCPFRSSLLARRPTTRELRISSGSDPPKKRPLLLFANTATGLSDRHGPGSYGNASISVVSRVLRGKLRGPRAEGEEDGAIDVESDAVQRDRETTSS